MPPALETRGLTKLYRFGPLGKPVRALNALDLSVERGEIFGFLGANGAGKTTTLKLLLRLAFPTSGEADLLGHRIPHTPTRRRIGYLPENPYFYDHSTPDELLRLHADLAGMRADERERRIGFVLERVRMERWRRAPLRSFSKGMVQRVGVAQALLTDPELLLLDEPTSGLDPVGRAEMRDLLLELRDAGKTIFLNSHLLSETEAICDRVAILRRGRMARQGTLHDLLEPRGIAVTAEGVSPALADRLRERGLHPSLEAHRIEVLLEDAAAVRPVVEAVFADGGTLLGVVPQRETLEELFLRVENDRAAGEPE